MLFSIVVPIYNVEKYLAECIESVLKQSYKDFELILVDDGSPDGCPSICDKYASLDFRIRVIHKKNEGVAVARKIGVDNAVGEYVLFVDADDLISSVCLEKIDKIIQMHSVDVIKFGFEIEKSDGSTYVKMPMFNGFFPKKRLETEVYPVLIHDKRSRYLGTTVCAGAFRTSIIKQFMIANPRAKIGEDSACVIPTIACSNSVFFLNEPFYFYRYNFTSATKSHKVFDWDNPEIIARHISEHIDVDSFDFKQQISRRVVHDVFNVAVTRFYQKKKLCSVFKEIRKEFDRPFYSDCAKNAIFKSNLKAQLMHLCVKRSLILPILMFSKIKMLAR